MTKIKFNINIFNEKSFQKFKNNTKPYNINS